MLEKLNKEKIKIGTERNFGLVFSIVFLIIAFYPLFQGSKINIWALFIFIFFLLFTFVYPRIFKIPNFLWFKFGLLLGKIVTPIVLMIIYFFVITPIGIILRLFGKNILNMKIDKNQKSYWINRSSNLNSFKNQF